MRKTRSTSAIVPIFFHGAVCHGADEGETYRQLAALVREEIAQLQVEGKELPPVTTRPMREAAGV